MQRNQKNVGTVERIVRVIGGGLLASGGLVVLAGGAATWWTAALAIAGIALGLDFVYTGLTGYCPLYHKLGLGTVPLREQGSTKP